jgi:hypothetical protein
VVVVEIHLVGIIVKYLRRKLSAGCGVFHRAD